VGNTLRSVAGALVCAWFSAGCAPEVAAPPKAPPSGLASDDSAICQGLADRFIGLPSFEESEKQAAKPSAGRWWIRRCSAARDRHGLKLQLQGPGWYYVDQTSSDFALREQVPFTLGVELAGDPSLSVGNGVFAVFFKPEGDAKVDLSIDRELHVRPNSTWGALLSAMPLVSVQRRATERLKETAESALRATLGAGATAIYDLRSGQADVVLGRARAGQNAPHAFEDGIAWRVNERLLLSADATQVVGPLEAGSTRLDVRIERGDGLAYWALCDRDLMASYATIAAGTVGGFGQSVASGSISGSGEHAASFDVEGCKFFIVLKANDRTTTIAALRVRA